MRKTDQSKAAFRLLTIITSLSIGILLLSFTISGSKAAEISFLESIKNYLSLQSSAIGSLTRTALTPFDTTPPETTITEKPRDQTNSGNARFRFTGTDDVGVTGFECSVDGAAFAACTSPHFMTGFSDGLHTFAVRAKDAANNVDPTPAASSWTIDRASPSVPVVLTPANGSTTNDSRPPVTGTAEPNSTVEIFIDGVSVPTATTLANASGNFSLTLPEPLSASSHTVRARAVDAAANVSSLSSANTFTVAPTPPTVFSIYRGSTNPSATATTVYYTVIFSENVTGVNAADFTLTTTGISGAGISSVSGSNWNYTVAVNTGAGTGTLRLDVTDDDSIIDVNGNPLGGTGAGNGNFTAGQAYTINDPGLTLGNYADTTVNLSGNATITPDAVPTGAAYATATTGADFKGKLEVDSATGVVRVTNAHPANAANEVYPVTVTAYGANGATTKTFNLTVATSAGCNAFHPLSFAGAANDAVSLGTNSAAVGDFNGDGKQDIAAANGNGNVNSVSVLIRNAANSSFDAKVDYTVGSTPQSVAVGDFNGDGKQDIATANNGSHNVSVLLRNAANNGFEPVANYAVGYGPQSVAVGDFNNDGKQDIVVANDFDNNASLYSNNVSVLLRNASNDGFDAAINITVGLGPASVAVGDFNGDGKQDIAVANSGPGHNTVSVILRNAANDGFDTKVDFTVGNNLFSVAAGDFNGDGRQDIAAVNTSGNTGSAYVLIRNAANTGFESVVDYPVASGLYSLAVGDFNNDGKQDLAISSSINNTVSVLLRNAANNGFDAKVDFPGGSFTRGLAIGDFNGDNRQDIAVANAVNTNVWVLQRVCNTPPTFTSVTNQTRAQGNAANSQIALVSDLESSAGSLTVTAPTVPPGITVSNIANNNGTITADVGAGNSTAPGDYTVVLNASDGELSTNANLIVTVAPTTPEIVVRGNNAVIADEDTTPALADHTDFGTVSTVSPFERTFTIENIGAPPLTVQNVTVSGGQASAFTVTQQPASSIQLLGTTTFKIQFAPTAAGLHSTTVSFGNDDPDENPFNFVIQGTGLEPPVLGNYASTSIALSGNTIITPDAAPTNTTSLTATTTADFKGELEVEPTTGVVRVTNAHPAGTYTITLKAANVIGTTTKTFTLTVTTPSGCNAFTASSFTPAVSYSNGGNNPFAVAIGDLNGDGKQDILTANGFSPNVSVFLRNGANNGFDSPLNFTVGSLVFSVAIGDFNADGKQDIVAGNNSSDTVSVLLRNAANNGFDPKVDLPVGDGPQSVAVGDFNGDGKQDIVAANENTFSTGNVSVLLRNAANNGFEPKVDFTVGGGPFSVTVGDFNADGKQDIATANGGNVSVLLRNAANNGFDPKVDYPTVPSARSITIGDFNGDGKHDLVSVSGFGASVLLRNAANNGFDSPVTYTTSTGALSVAIGDFNNDGKQDIATANSTSSGSVSVLLRNAANNGFDPKVDFAAGTNTRSVAVGDFNGDNLQDIVAANSNGQNVSVFQRLCNNPPTFTSITNQNRPQGTSSNAQIAAVSDDITAAGSLNVQATTVPSGVTVSNIANNNGTITADVGAGNSTAPGDYTVVLTVFDGELSTNANLTVTVPPTTPEIVVRGNNAVIADEDTTPSLTDHTDFGIVSVGIVQERTFTIENIGVPSLTLGNVTVSGGQANAFTVTQQPASPVGLNNSTTFKIQFAPTALGLQSTTISFGNNDNDENPFNFVIQGTGVAAATLGNYADTTIAVSGNTIITPSAAPADTVYATAATTADFKGEIEINPATGVVRVTNAQPAGAYTVALRAANAGGTTTKTFTLTVNTPPSCTTFDTSSFTTASSLGVGTSPNSVAVGDINGDGKQDLVTANVASGVNTVSVLIRNAANNGFEPKVDYTVGTQPSSAAIADFNGDGKQDLAVANSANKVSILYRNAANDGFDTPVNFTVGNNANSFAIADFNNDGKPDIAVNDSGLNRVFVLMRNAANDGFDSPVNFTVGNNPVSIAAGDFNGDGKPDIVTANSSGGNVSVLFRNTANNGFEPAVNFTAGINPGLLAIGDYNNDGKQDIATNNFSDSVSLILRNAANTGFDSPVNINLGSSINRLEIGDFNNDGKQDLAVIRSSNTLSVLLRNTANNGFDPKVDFTIGNNPQSMAVGDFNSDRKQDIAIAHNGGNLSVLQRSGNCPPVITPSIGLTRQQGTAAGNSQIAAVDDVETARGSLTVQATTVPSGITVSNIVNNNGTITADIAADCSATIGNNTIVLSVTDADNASTNANLTVNVSANTAPSLTYPNATVLFNGSTTINPSAASDNGVAAYSLQSQGTYTGGISVNNTTGAVSIGSAAPAGTHTITIRAADNCSVTTDAGFTLTVNQPPAITSANNTTFAVGANGSFTVTTTGFPASSISKNGTLPNGVTFTDNGNGTASLAGAPAAGTGGTYPIIITANNGISPNAAQNFTLTVNQAPEFTGANSTTFTVGAAGSFQLTASGFPAPTFSPSGTLPSGITLSNSGLLSGTPTSGSGGVYTFTVTASNGVSPDATQEFTLTVNQPPAISSANNTAFIRGTPGSFQAAATGFPAPAFSIFSGTLPSGVTFSSSGLLAGTSTQSGVFQLTIRATNVAGTNDQAFTLTIHEPPTLGNYADTTIALSGNTIVAPDSAPANATSVTAATSADFKGELEIDPASGVVRVTNAYPDGIYAVTTRASGPGGTVTKTFNLTVTTLAGCGFFNALSFSPAANFSVATNPNGIAVGDFNADGRQDLAVANVNSNNVSVLIRNAANTGFETAVNLAVGIQPQSVAVGDLNADGKQDIAVSNGSISSNSVSVLLRNAANTGFDPAVNISVGANPRGVAIGDFNADGRQDIVVSNSGSDNVSVLIRNTANTGFVSEGNVSAGSSPQSVAAGDFNNDGRLDIVTANLNSNNVSVLLRNATNDGFVAALNLSVGSSPLSATVGDFNADGKPDIAAANFNNNNVSVLLRNAANNGFDSAVNFSVGTNPASVAVGDFNNDGKQDIAAANANSANVSVLLRNAANNGFNAAVNFSVGSGPRFVAVGDFNADGRQDIAAANQFNGNVSVLQRNCNLPPSITAATGLSKQQGTAASNSQIAVVSDNETPAGNLTVQATTVPSGITVTNIVNNNGTITADIAADCSATTGGNTIVLTVTDANNASTTANLTVNITANTAPVVGNYPNTTVNAASSGNVVTPASAPSDNGSIQSIAASASAGFTGTFTTNTTTGAVTINNAAPAGTYSITVTVTDNCGAATSKQFTLIVNAAPTVSAQANVSRQQGNAVTNSQIATVNDADQAEETLAVTVNGAASATANGVTISNIAVSAAGVVTADVAANCSALDAGFILRVTDSNGAFNEATLNVATSENTAPTLTYQNASVISNGSTTINPSAASDNGVAAYSLHSQGTYTGTISVNSSTGAVSIGSAAPAGTHTITVRATDNCNVATDAGFTLTIYQPSVSGMVSYGITQVNQQQKFVSGVLLSAAGASTASGTTDSTGAYLIENLSSGGNYTITPSKTGNRNGITAFDATLVLRCVAAGSNCALTPNQKIAASTDNDPQVTAFDATQILRYVAANGQNANTGQVGNWKFDPGSKTYSNLNGNQPDQNYAAYLVGEVDGDWAAPNSLAESSTREQSETKQDEIVLVKAEDTSVILSTSETAPVNKLQSDSTSEVDNVEETIFTEEPPNEAPEIQLSLPENASVAAGSTISIPVLLTNQTGIEISSYNFAVLFDPAVLQPEEAAIETAESLSSNGFLIVSESSQKGRIGIAASAPNKTISNSGTLLYLRFRVANSINNTGKSFTALNFEMAKKGRSIGSFFADEFGNNIISTSANGSFTVVAGKSKD